MENEDGEWVNAGKDYVPDVYEYCSGMKDLVVGVTPNAWFNATMVYGTKSTATMQESYTWDETARKMVGEAPPSFYYGSDQYAACSNLKIAKGRDLSPLDWTRPARALHDQVRGLIPWPAAVTELDGTRCKVLATTVVQETTDKAPGTVLAADKHGLKLACGEGTVLSIDELQPDGKKRMKSADFLRGHPIPVG